jgi:4'-phosphopantetheinyl transferase
VLNDTTPERLYGLPEPGAVHVWGIRLPASEEDVQAAVPLLGADERARSARLQPGPLRSGFVMAHAALRKILSCYTRKSAGTLAIERSTHGKPGLADSAVTFNLSHSGQLALCAIARGAHVGVDVEALQAVPDAAELFARWFSPAEAAKLARIPPATRAAAFLATWTRKEAFLKATGEGLQRPLDSFEVSIPPEPARLVSVDGRAHDKRWAMRSIYIWTGYVATIACEGPVTSVTLRQWLCPKRTRDLKVGAHPHAGKE